jgi:magnesium transporter
MGMLESASNFFFSSQSHKMNEIMKTLTIVSVFYSFDVYSWYLWDEFEHMPELKYQNGYYTITHHVPYCNGMMIYFKRENGFSIF